MSNILAINIVVDDWECFHYPQYLEYKDNLKMKVKINHKPVIGGGSITEDGPKNDGIDDVEIGVFKSSRLSLFFWFVLADTVGIKLRWFDGCCCCFNTDIGLFKFGMEPSASAAPPEEVTEVRTDEALCCGKDCWFRIKLLAVTGDVIFGVDERAELWDTDFRNPVSNPRTLKWAAAADSVNKNVWCVGVTNVSSPSMIMVVECVEPGATPPISIKKIYYICPLLLKILYKSGVSLFVYYYIFFLFFLWF